MTTEAQTLSRVHVETPDLLCEPGQAPATFWVSEVNGGVFLQHLLHVRHWMLQGANQTLTHGAYILEENQLGPWWALLPIPMATT